MDGLNISLSVHSFMLEKCSTPRLNSAKRRLSSAISSSVFFNHASPHDKSYTHQHQSHSLNDFYISHYQNNFLETSSLSLLMTFHKPNIFSLQPYAIIPSILRFLSSSTAFVILSINFICSIVFEKSPMNSNSGKPCEASP